MKEDISLEEVNGHAIDVVFAGVDTVRKLEETNTVEPLQTVTSQGHPTTIFGKYLFGRQFDI